MYSGLLDCVHTLEQYARVFNELGVNRAQGKGFKAMQDFVVGLLPVLTVAQYSHRQIKRKGETFPSVGKQ